MTRASANVLIVHENPSEAASLQACLEELGHTVCAAVSSGPQAVEAAAAARPDVALIDLGLGGEVSGIEAAELIGSPLDVAVVYLDGDVEEELWRQAQATRPFGYLRQPFEKRQLHLTVQTALSLQERENGHRENVARLERRARRMEAVFDGMHDGVIAADEDGEYLVFNAGARRMFGSPVAPGAENQRSRVYGLFQPDRVTPFADADLPLARAVAGGSSDEVEMFVRNMEAPTGRLVSVTGRPVPGDGRGAQGGMVVCRDVTREREARAESEQSLLELRMQSKLMEAVLDNIDDGVVLSDVTERVKFVNARAKQIFGTGNLNAPLSERARAYGIFYSDKETYVPTDQLPLVRAVNGEDTEGMSLYIRNPANPHGVAVTARGRALLRTDRGGARAGMAVFRDTAAQEAAGTRLSHALDRLRSQTELMEAICDNISDGIIVIDTKGAISFVNSATEKIFGYWVVDPEMSEWASTFGIFYPDVKTPVPFDQLPIVRALQGEETEEVELFVRNQHNPDGTYIKARAVPIYNHDRTEIIAGMAIVRDITEQVHAQEALSHAFAQGRLEIVETILHNIGNAINSVTVGIDTVDQKLAGDPLLRRLRSLADAVKDHEEDWIDYVTHDPQGQKVMPFIVAIADDFTGQNQQLRGTVQRVKDRANHIADIVRTQKAIGGPGMDRKDVNLENAIAAAVKVLQDSLQRRNARIEVDCGNAPREIRIRESQFHQMMVNLVKNSLEAIDELTASGGLRETPRIRIRAHVEGESFILEVNDNGIGIDRNRQQAIFTAGYTTKESGTGLGLHSSAYFVAESGGQIHPLSDGVGKGTTMRIQLPLSSITAPESAVQDAGHAGAASR